MGKGKIVGIGILVVVILIGTFWGGLYLKRYRYSLEKEAVKHSLQYTESKQAMLMELATEWHQAVARGEEAVATVLYNRIKLESAKLHEKEVPEDIKSILGRGI